MMGPAYQETQILFIWNILWKQQYIGKSMVTRFLTNYQHKIFYPSNIKYIYIIPTLQQILRIWSYCNFSIKGYPYWHHCPIMWESQHVPCFPVKKKYPTEPRFPCNKWNQFLDTQNWNKITNNSSTSHGIYLNSTTHKEIQYYSSYSIHKRQ